MQAVKLGVGLAVAIGLQVAGAWLLPSAAPRVFDPFLVVVVLNALGGSSLGGFAGGSVAGLLHDAFSGRLFGFHGFADTIVGYAVARTAQRLDLAGPAAVLVVAALATLLQQAILVFLAYLFTELEPPAPLWVVLEALVNGTAGALFAIASSRARSVADSARRRRLSKIRL